MMDFPRLALATSAAGPDPSIAALAMLAGLTERRLRVQHFRSVACPTTTESVGQATGLPGRHLDAWLMPCAVQENLFARGARHADLAIVEGTLDEGAFVGEWETSCDKPGLLRPIAESLDLPIIAVVSCRSWNGVDGVSHLPRIPTGAEAVLVDDLEDQASLEPIRRLIRLCTGRPVIGAVNSLGVIRRQFQEAPRHGTLPEESIRALARSFLKHADLGLIREISESRPVSGSWSIPDSCGSSRPSTRLAYAQDDAFGRYFPDTLEALEAMGADLVSFSPLRDEAVPDGADIVMIGCGFPDRFVDELSANASMIASLRAHVCRGKRIYSEGGGTAYLGRSMILPDRRVQGVGILPFDAVLLPDARPPIPVTRTLIHDTWLGAQGTIVRGYRSRRWKLMPKFEPFDCPACYGALTPDHDFTFHHHAVGSLIHLHLGALPEVVAAFAGPHRPSLRRPSN
jgi:cobyrinic acid a,c-diamide synthase